jgi:hypothetical protein
MLTILIGFLTNMPILFGYDLISDKIRGRTFYFMQLNQFGDQSSFGVLMVLDAIVIDVIIFICVLFINGLLVVSIRDHSRKLYTAFGRRSRNNRYNGADGGEGFVEDIDQEESSSNVVITYINNNDNNGAAAAGGNSEQQQDGPVEIQLDQSSGESSKIKKRIEVQTSIKSTSKMIQMTSLVYLFGHLLYSLAGILVQLRYFESYANYTLQLLGRDITIDFVSSLLCLFLYISFGANFLVYCFFNELFYSLLSDKMRILFGGHRFILLD